MRGQRRIVRKWAGLQAVRKLFILSSSYTNQELFSFWARCDLRKEDLVFGSRYSSAYGSAFTSFHSLWLWCELACCSAMRVSQESFFIRGILASYGISCPPTEHSYETTRYPQRKAIQHSISGHMISCDLPRARTQITDRWAQYMLPVHCTLPKPFFITAIDLPINPGLPAWFYTSHAARHLCAPSIVADLSKRDAARKSDGRFIAVWQLLGCCCRM